MFHRSNLCRRQCLLIDCCRIRNRKCCCTNQTRNYSNFRKYVHFNFLIFVDHLDVVIKTKQDEVNLKN